MSIKRGKFGLVLSLLLLFAAPVFAGDVEHEENHTEERDIKAEIKADIKHHLLDAHDFHFFTDKTTGKHYSFPLPVILYDEGFHFFMSSAFHHGETVVESKGKNFKLYHNKIYSTDAEGTIEYDGEHHALNDKPVDFSITKNVLSIVIAGMILLLLFGAVARSYKKQLAPKGIARFLEPLVIFVRDEIARPNIGEKHYKKYMGYLLTVFFFIWLLNLLGLTPLGINVTGNIAITFSLALITFLITNFTGKKGYWRHIFDPLGGSMPLGGKLVVYLLLIPIEILGMIIKPFALMIRLYANISAGHIVIMSLIGLLFVFESWGARGAFFGLTLFLSVIELLVAFLQAYIFTMLTALYFGFASEEGSH